VVGYVRVSKDDQHPSVEAQRRELERRCVEQGLTLNDVYADVGSSGARQLDKRPGLLEALNAPEKGTRLLVVRRDRLARDTLTAAVAEWTATEAGATIRGVHGGGDDSTPEIVLMRAMIEAFAQYERALISMSTKAVLRRKRDKQEKTGGEVPYGWQLRADGIHLDPHAKEQDAILAARKLREEGYSLRAIAVQLVELGHLPGSGRAWHPETVKHLLSAEALDWPWEARS
jgi:DNA invertase Pin-like site-specific DNA recombinase